jgi:hypothetical protein
MALLDSQKIDSVSALATSFSNATRREIEILEYKVHVGYHLSFGVGIKCFVLVSISGLISTLTL